MVSIDLLSLLYRVIKYNYMMYLNNKKYVIKIDCKSILKILYRESFFLFLFWCGLKLFFEFLNIKMFY